jgi:hypothetical protein
VSRFLIFLAISAITFVYLSANRTKFDAIGTWRIVIAVEMAGCAQLESLDKLNDYIDQGDPTAYGRSLSQAIFDGQCILFTYGEEVYVIDAARSKVRVRLRGDTTEYWTSRRAIAEPKAN